MNKLRAEAVELRLQGYSYNMIRQELGVAKSSMSYWFRDISYTPGSDVTERIRRVAESAGTRMHNAKVKDISEQRARGIAEIGVLSKRDLWLLGIGIFIGEGAKTIESVRITNADPLIIKLAIKWLKEICGLTNNNLKLRIHLYPDTDIPAAQKYWEEITGLEAKNFMKAIVDTRENKAKSRAGKLPYGTVHVSVVTHGDKEKGARLYRRLNGWVAGVMQQI